jgi:tRNA pseudouridine65 synthase
MQAKGFEKEYLAIVRGYTEPSGEIDYALKEVLDKMTDAKAKEDKAAQSALTFYETISQVELPFEVGRYPTARYSFVRLRPKTGRKHQLRRHMKHLLHPIVGDTNYGRGEHNRFFREQFGIQRLLLHAYELKFTHPVSGKAVGLRAKLDLQFLDLIAELGLENGAQTAHSAVF